jgi:iduronate 2-sulfatase
MDRKLGTLLDELEKLGLAEKTAIILHADHGWALGEHGMWHTMTNFDTTVRVPLIIKAPGVGPGGRTGAIAELVDLYPTIAELAGLPLPQGEIFDGKSLVPVLQDSTASVKSHAFSQYPRRVLDPTRPWHGTSTHRRPRTAITHMGYTVRSPEFRYTEWYEWNQTTLKPIWDRLYARELYDHRNVSLDGQSNYNSAENENVVDHAEFAETGATLSRVIRSQFDDSSATLLV